MACPGQRRRTDVRRLLAHRDARLYLGGQALIAVVDCRVLLAAMAAVIAVSAVYLVGQSAEPPGNRVRR